MNDFYDMKNEENESTCVIILGAGFSSRMTTPKILLSFGDEGTFLEKIISSYRSAGINSIYLTVNSETQKALIKSGLSVLPELKKIIINPFPERERFFSIQNALRSVESYNNYFIQDSDRPFVDSLLLGSMMSTMDSDYLIPEYNGKGGHPVIISENVKRFILNADAESTTLRGVLGNFDGKRFPVESPSVLININSQEDYQRYFGKE